MHYKWFAKEAQHWLIVICWIGLAVMCASYLQHAGKPFKIGNINDPSAESAIAKKTIEKQLPFSSGRIFILYKSKTLTVDQPGFVSQVEKSLSGLKKLPFEYRIISPYKNRQQIAKNKHVAYAVIETNTSAEELANSMNKVCQDLGKPKSLEMYIGGDASYISDVYQLSETNLVRAELISLPICFLIMIAIFRGLLAAMLTIFIGIINITIIITILYLLAHQIDLTVFVLNIATMLGLGLSLDYTLLITYRFREEYLRYQNHEIAIHITLATAGKSVAFSGLIVLISIASLIFFPIDVLYSIGIGGIVVIIVTVLSSVTFLPAMLCLFEKYITRTNPKLKSMISDNNENYWYTFAMLVMKYPLSFFIPTVFVLLCLGYPFFNVKLNSSDAKILPLWTDSRILLDQFNMNFNANELTPISILLIAKNKSILSKNNIGAIYDYAERLKKDHRVSQVTSLVSIKPGLSKQAYQGLYRSSSLPFNEYQKQLFKSSTKGKYTVMSIVSKYSKEDKRNFKLIKTIRAQKIGEHITKQVTGQSAEIIDTIAIIYHLFFKILVVISLITYITLVCLLRSLILPLKAILMNFLSLSVCYGMLIFIFQEGHFASLFHFKTLGYTDMTLPILLFFGLFGLSMDYEVFLLSRIKEYYEKTGDNIQSVSLGLERSARIITGAALVMVIVTGAFVTADVIFIKAFGLGTALAITIDATLIRLLLVPATMRLLGDWNWYIPKWLDKILPDLHFDREIPSEKTAEQEKNDK